MKNIENISETEIRVIGQENPHRESNKKRKWLLLAVAVIAGVVIVVLAVVCSRNQESVTDSAPSVYEPIVVREQPHPLREWLVS